MRTLLLSLLAMSLSLTSYAQEVDTSQVYVIVDTPPEFEGGLETFFKVVGAKINYPTYARTLGIEGNLIIEFTISRDGTMEDIFVRKHIGLGCDEVGIEAIKASQGKWTAGSHKGTPVDVRLSVPIIFRLPEPVPDRFIIINEEFMGRSSTLRGYFRDVKASEITTIKTETDPEILKKYSSSIQDGDEALLITMKMEE